MATNYEEIQENEMEVLRSIYMDDFVQEEVKTGAWNKTADRAFRLQLKPPSDNSSDISAVLSISLPATYPKTLPHCTLNYGDRVRSKTRAMIEELVKTKPTSLIGSEMIFELATSIQDILDDYVQKNGRDILALDEERALQEATTQQMVQRAAEERLQQQKEAGAEEVRLLSRMVEQEQARLAKVKRKSSEVRESSLDQVHKDAIHFDQPIQTRNLQGSMLAFRTVRGKAKYRYGVVSDVFTVYPVAAEDDSAPFLALKECIVQSIEHEDKLKRVIQSLESNLEILISLPAHPNILKPLAFLIQKGAPEGWSIGILTRLMTKGSLKDLLESIGTLSVSNVRSWVIQIVEGLDFYHRRGVVHAGIHLSNILLERTDTGTIVKLSDGLYQHDLHILKDKSDTEFTKAASIYWTAPELLHNIQGKISSPTDIWDLGVALIQMLFGLEVQRQYASPVALTEGLSLSRSLDSLVTAIFKADPKKRITAFEFLPHEFLRNDDSVLDQPSPPGLSRITSSTSITSSKPIRARHDSTNMMITSSRYLNDFVEAGRLGRGGFGEVVRARNKLDGRFYAIKKITQNSASALSGVLSEIILLSRMNHPNIVRYFTAWIEDEGEEDAKRTIPENEASDFSSIPDIDSPHVEFGSSAPGLDFISSSGYPKGGFADESSDEDNDFNALEDDIFERDGEDDEQKSRHGDTLQRRQRRRPSAHAQETRTTLYIQMEYCEKQTLRDLIKGDLHANNEECWRLFRQVLEGLAHVHSNGIIHRDLKPDNIFIDSSNNVRIGDFGLARPGDYHATSQKHTNGSIDPSLTRSIGTAFYVAPEVRSRGNGSYNEKADMYSLGIILFEMTVPFSTAMERAQMLGKMREFEHVLPPIFEKPENSVQGDIIISLVNHRPSDRPSSSSLLRSGKVPIQVEDETIRVALQGIEDNTSPYYTKLMSALFAQSGEGARVKDFTYDLDVRPNLSTDDLLLQSLVKEQLISTFRRHGAIEMRRPLLLPNSSYYSNAVVRLLNASGDIVQLPYDLTLPNARTLAKQPSSTRKTFAFGDVYREVMTGGHPRSHGEVDFDIISHDNLDLALREAEVLKVLDEIIDAFPSFASTRMCYHINHSQLLNRILAFCDIAVSKWPTVKESLSKLNIGQWTWVKIRNELRAPSIGVASTSLDDLMRFDFRDTYDKAIPMLRRIIEDTEDLEPIFSHLYAVIKYLKRFHVTRKVYINPLSSFNEKFFRGNILFQSIYDTKKRDVFAAGGRYDQLIQDHRANCRIDNRHAVGFNLGWEKLLTSMTRYHSTSAKSFLKKSETDLMNPWLLRRCDVRVDSFDPATLRSTGVGIVQELWANDISAELVIDATTDTPQQQNQDETQSHSWIITIKQDGSLRVRSVAKQEESDIHNTELIGWLRSEIRERDRSASKANERIRLPRQKSQHDRLSLPYDHEPDVRVLTSMNKSKKTNRRNLVEDAQTRSLELLQSSTSGPIAAIELKDDLFDSIRETRLSDPDSWRRLIQSAPLADRQYLGHVHELLRSMADEVKGGTRNAFVYNFRTRGCFYYDLGKAPK